LGNLEGVIVPLERLLTYELPDDIRAEVTTMLDEARA